MNGRLLRVHRLGRVEYPDGLELQRLFGEARRAGSIPDTLLLLEHPRVLTLGRAAKRSHILASEEQLAAKGIQVFETSRGGDVTYHGPGQLVGYPVLLLSPDRQDVRKYVRNLEGALIRALARFDLRAGRIDGWTGVWLGSREQGDARKVAAIGVHLSRWLTGHGFALNVNTALEDFQWIVPCGIQEAGVTSIRDERRARVQASIPEIDWDEVQSAVVESFCDVFGYQLEQEAAPSRRTVCAAVLRQSGPVPEVLLLRRTPARGGFWQIVTGKVEAGESPAAAAAREVLEETGQLLAPVGLDYRHTFAWGEALPPVLIEETAFAALWPEGAAVRLNAEEHDSFLWLPAPQAMEQLPFQGLKEAVRRAAALGHRWPQTDVVPGPGLR